MYFLCLVLYKELVENMTICINNQMFFLRKKNWLLLKIKKNEVEKTDINYIFAKHFRC